MWKTWCQRGGRRAEGESHPPHTGASSRTGARQQFAVSRLKALLTAGRPGILRETSRVIYLPASQLIGLGDVGVDHEGAAEGR